MRSMAALAATLIALVVGLSGASATTPNGIRGTVIKSPTSPVCREGVPCSAPAAGVVLVFTRGGLAAARATTLRDGSFSVALAPGTYVIRTLRKSLIGGMRAHTVEVRQGRFAVVRLSIDTGIR
jgi:hypothetical protein